MNKTLLIVVRTLLFITFCNLNLVAQKQVPIPVELEGFVLEFDQPYSVMTVELGKNLFDTKETIILNINSQTQILNHKKKPLTDKSEMVTGTKIKINAEKVGSVFNAARIMADGDLSDQSIAGYYERLDKLAEGETAWISGQAVRLAPGVIIKGENQWKKKTFSSFDDMMLGSFVKLKGKRNSTGIFIANQGETKPNMFTSGDLKLREAVRTQSAKKLKEMGNPPALVTVDKAGKWGYRDDDTGRETTVMTTKVPNGVQIKINDKEYQLKSLPDYVTDVGNKLIPQYIKDLPDADPAKIQFRFFVKVDDTFNAFALPDGTIVVHTGLLKTLKNESQLAAVLGHEIAHVTHEHSRRMMANANPWMWAVIGAGVGLGQGGAQMANIVASLFLLDFSRDMEDEADRGGLFYLANAGYDPREAPHVWQQVIDKIGKKSEAQNFFTSGHSTPQDRLRNLNREISRNYRKNDFASTNKGVDSYLVNVGFNFGWIKLIEEEEFKQKVDTNQPKRDGKQPPGKNGRKKPNN
jgi:hypothetical protein